MNGTASAWYKLENQWHIENICQKLDKMATALSINTEEDQDCLELNQKLKSNSKGEDNKESHIHTHTIYISPVCKEANQGTMKQRQ